MTEMPTTRGAAFQPTHSGSVARYLLHGVLERTRRVVAVLKVLGHVELDGRRRVTGQAQPVAQHIKGARIAETLGQCIAHCVHETERELIPISCYHCCTRALNVPSKDREAHQVDRCHVRSSKKQNQSQNTKRQCTLGPGHRRRRHEHSRSGTPALDGQRGANGAHLLLGWLIERQHQSLWRHVATKKFVATPYTVVVRSVLLLSDALIERGRQVVAAASPHSAAQQFRLVLTRSANVDHVVKHVYEGAIVRQQVALNQQYGTQLGVAGLH